MTTSLSFHTPLPASLRFRLWATRLMAAAGLGSDGRRDAERMFLDVAHNYGKLVASICLSFARTKEEFEDIRQDALLNIWRGIDSFKSGSSTSTWVYRVTLNTCISYRRKEKRWSRREEVSTEYYHELFSCSEEDEIERYELMYKLIYRLPPLDRSVLMMWLDDKAYGEIAEVTGLSVNAVAARLRRTKDKLATMAGVDE